MSVFTKRLKEARMIANLSQEQLGIRAGLEEASASARMNRYELGKRTPDFELVQRFSKVLNVPAAYFFSDDDEIAWLLVVLHRMPKDTRQKIIATARELNT
jgi:transcriptional regulator with XRE-family HTH domain